MNYPAPDYPDGLIWIGSSSAELFDVSQDCYPGNNGNNDDDG